MKDRKTDREQVPSKDESTNSSIKRDDSGIASETLQSKFIQRGRLDIHHHQTAAKHLKQGADALNARDYQKAIEEFLLVIQHNRESAEAHFHLGLAYFMLEDYEKAIDAYKMAIACEPSEVAVYINLASTYRMLKRYDEAIDVYENAIRFIPNHPELHSELGAVYSLRGKRREAISAFKSAMRLKLKSSKEFQTNGKHRRRIEIVLNAFVF